MKWVLFPNYGGAAQMQSTVSTLCGYPARGRKRNGEWDGPPSPGHGWTLRQYNLLQNDSTTPTSYAHPDVDIDDSAQMADIGGDINRLNASQQSQMRAWHATAQDIPSDW